MKIHEFNGLLHKINTNTYAQQKLNIGTDPFNEETEQYQLKDDQVLLLAAAIKQSPCIIDINLGGNKISDVGAIALAEIDSLKTINLTFNHITAQGAYALATSKVVKLNLSENNINIDDHQLVNALIHNNTITELNLRSSLIPSHIVAKLIKYNTTIQTLHLGDDLTDEALEFIGKNETLEKLSINTNQITNKGAEYLANNNNLKILFLEQSNINDTGAKILSKHLSLKELTLQDSNITKNGSECFFDSNLKKVTIFNGIKHDFMSSKEAWDFKHKFEAYQLKKLHDQQEYYHQITNGEQYAGINPDMNDIDSIQNAIDILQNQWAKDEIEQRIMGDMDYS